MGSFGDLGLGGGSTVQAWRATPEGPPKGGIVLIQEIFGVNAHIRSVAERYAGHGYAVVTPSLFDLVEPGVELPYDESGFTRGRELKGQLPPEQVLPVIAAALAEAREATGKAATLGFCWGGLLAWLSATRLAPDASVGYYGGGTIAYRDETPTCPVLLHFGEHDSHIPLDEVKDLHEAHRNIPMHVYEGAGHGFNCDARGDYHPEAARLAEERTLSFLATHLG